MPVVDPRSQTRKKLSPKVPEHLETDPVAGSCAWVSTPGHFRTSLESQSEAHSISVDFANGHDYRPAILLVEDEETLRNALAKMLQRKGFEVLAAADGTAAVDQLRVHGERLTLLMLDVTLPGLPSRNVLEEARRIRPGIIVVLTSALRQDVAESSFDGLQVDCFIRKPFRLAILIELLERVLPSL